MGSTTGIELGADTCVLAGVRTTRSGSEIVALHTMGPAAWPSQDSALAETLREIRKSGKFPRRARVVAWDLPEDATDDIMSRAAMRPLAAAGFIVERVVTPPQALTILASTRARPGVRNTGAAWLALNMHGAAIAIVRGSELLFERTFQWTYNPHLIDGKAQLLQRYSLVAHLAPELRRGIGAVRASHGMSIDAVVTCGDLPELRSLTMPLIAELDLEVETLDSLEGLPPVGKARLGRLAESAPAIRLACAAALARGRRRSVGFPRVARIAVSAAALAALGYGAYAFFTPDREPAVSSHAPQSAPRRSPKPAGAAGAKPAVLPAASTPFVAASARVSRHAARTVPRTPLQSESPSSTPAMIFTRPEIGPAPLAPEPAENAVAAKTELPDPRITPIVMLKPATGKSPIDRGLIFPDKRPAPLPDPLPTVDSILIDPERRLAIINGAVAAMGGRVGQRLVVQIERDVVVFEEPSGLLVRVPLRSGEGRF